MGHGFLGWMWLWPLLIIGAIFGCFAVMGGWGRWNRPMRHSASADASEILRLRYAQGEITREQFEQMKKDLL
ncbi:MAG: SHOCT domain-containing protein [Acidobacteria bacterium]|nr:SHOCT domain-containing protein [Acidobacteriota bacterium]